MQKLMFDIIIPVLNEEQVIGESLARVAGFLDKEYAGRYRIIVADSGSRDRTRQIAQNAAKENPAVRYVDYSRKGRGYAIRASMDASSAPVHICMDADLPVELERIAALLEELEKNDLAVGNRFSAKSRVRRSLPREALSQAYNRFATSVLDLPWMDLQCGFKGIRHSAWRRLGPSVQDDGLFFDTELVFVAMRLGMKVKPVPIIWDEGSRPTRINIPATAANFVKSVVSLKMRRF